MPIEQHNDHLIIRLPDAIKDVYFGNNGIGLYHYENDVPVILKFWDELKELKEVFDNIPFEDYKEGLLKGFELGYKSNELLSLEDNKRQMVKKVINCPGFPINLREPTYFKNEDVYKFGVIVGVNYWIWKQILESPEAFETIFLECSKSKGVESNSQRPTSTKSSKHELESFKKLSDIFKDPRLMTPCLGVLKEVDPPLLNQKGQFIIGGLKSALVVWIDELKYQGFIKGFHNQDKIIADLLTSEIEDFKIESSNFRKHSTRAIRYYKQDFKTLLSQVSQSGK